MLYQNCIPIRKAKLVVKSEQIQLDPSQNILVAVICFLIDPLKTQKDRIFNAEATKVFNEGVPTELFKMFVTNSRKSVAKYPHSKN